MLYVKYNLEQQKKCHISKSSLGAGYHPQLRTTSPDQGDWPTHFSSFFLKTITGHNPSHTHKGVISLCHPRWHEVVLNTSCEKILLGVENLPDLVRWSVSGNVNKSWDSRIGCLYSTPQCLTIYLREGKNPHQNEGQKRLKYNWHFKLYFQEISSFLKHHWKISNSGRVVEPGDFSSL